jgi:hypothetical protein
VDGSEGWEIGALLRDSGCCAGGGGGALGSDFGWTI